MSATTAKSGAVAIRPFHVDIPEEALVDLRRRIAAVRWPSRELVDDRSQGVQLAAIREPELFSSEIRAAFRTLR